MIFMGWSDNILFEMLSGYGYNLLGLKNQELLHAEFKKYHRQVIPANGTSRN